MYIPKDSHRDRNAGREPTADLDPAVSARPSSNVTFGNNTGQVFWDSTVHCGIQHRGGDIGGGPA